MYLAQKESTMRSMTTSPTKQPVYESPRSAQKPARSIALEIVTLIFLGAVAGTVASFAILAVGVVFAQLGNPTSTTFLELLASIFSRMLNVLVVWVQAPLDGAKMGVSVGLAVSAAYLIATWIDRSLLFGTSRRWLTLLLLPIAGTVGALLGSQGVLADSALWVAAGGALFGLVAAFSLAPSASR